MLRRSTLARALASSWLFATHAAAAPPPGQSALLNGMHDIEALSWMATATPGCDKGWITDLQYIGSSGSAGGNCHQDATAAGVSVIQRLDLSGGASYPTSSAEVSGFASSFASFASKCSNIHVWIVGNEPNFTVDKSDPDCSTDSYAAAYAAVHAKVHALPGHEQDLVLVAPNSPYSPGCLESLRNIIDAVKAKGVTPDGFALHAYTRAPNGGALTANLVTSSATQNDTTIDDCPGGATWNDTWHSHFRIYLDYIQVIEAAGLQGKPVFISESGNACDVAPGNACYPDANIGYFQALYADAAAHNAGAATKIRAITPYRWTKNDDQTGRDFEIGARPQLLEDLKQAFAKQPSWTTVGCGGSGSGGTGGSGGTSAGGPCTDDGDCAGQQICDLSQGQCAATSPCGPGGSCAAGMLCRQPENDCVPESRGVADIAVSPKNPAPGGAVVLDVSAVDGYTNVGLELVGPAGSLATELNDIYQEGSLHHWEYGATAGDTGTHRATFTADPDGTTVYAIAYFQVGDVEPPADAGAGGAGSGGSLDRGGTEAADDGCACRVRGAPRNGWLLAALAATLWLLRRRRDSAPT